MSESKTSPFMTALFSLFPVALLLIIDLFTLYLQTHNRIVAHLNLAVLSAQMLCVFLFIKGQICPGQRGRLKTVNLWLAMYWIVILLLSFASTYHFIFTDFIAVCGLGALFTVWQQPADDENLRNMLLRLGMILLTIGIGLSLMVIYYLPSVYWFIHSPFAQIAIGVILAYLLLIHSRSRLQQFMALLPMIIVALLGLNVIFLLVLFYMNTGFDVPNEMALLLYFVLHLAAVAILLFCALRNIKPNYYTLSILLICTSSLPLWATFVFIV